MAEMTDVGRLPAITRYVIATAKFTLQYLGLTLILMLLFIIFMIIISSIYKKFVLRRPEDPSFLSLIGDRIKWRLPVLHWFERNYSMIQTVEMLRLSLNAGCTVNEAIANTIDLDINTRFRDHIKEWLEKVEAGYNISESAENSELGSALAWAFDDKVNQGNTITILETLEAFYRTNYNYSINIVRFILWPCIVLCIGIIVGTIAVAFFLPSAQIINNLANQISP
jgi:type II secretory pathway component PulF